MKIFVSKTSKQLGEEAAKLAAKSINECIASKGNARIVLSTGASQLETIEALIKQDVDWSKVEMFHLDEYVGISETHVASFKKYLKEKFVSKINLKAAYFVEPTAEIIPSLSAELRKSPIDVGLVGIGENAHIAFNDPPADFDTTDAYIVVALNDTCKKQQVGEGWFANEDEVPKNAISMSVHQILLCEKIITCVPYAIKANAIKDTLYNSRNNMIPATVLKEHKDFNLFVDADSFSLVEKDKILPAENDKNYFIEIL